jgi:GNAT superfamily N-acetyltransferase
MISPDQRGASRGYDVSRLRVAAAGDAEAIAALVSAAFRVERFFIDGDRIDAQEVLTLLEKGIFLLAPGANGGLAACVYLEVQGERGYFGLLSVDPALQGAGLGRGLVVAAEDHCRAAGCKVMEIRVVNIREQLPPYYRRLGYVESGAEPFPTDKPTKRPCHFLKMSKLL